MDLDNATGHPPTDSDKRERLKTVHLDVWSWCWAQYLF
jgi:hypothetical protein